MNAEKKVCEKKMEETKIDWDEVDWLMENGYWPDYDGDYHIREYIDDKVEYTFKMSDFALDYLWAKDYYFSNNCCNIKKGLKKIKLV